MNENILNDESLALSVWQGNLLRLTAFPSPDAFLDPSDWWKFVFGEAAETRISKPKIGLHQEEGSYESGKWILKVEPIRIDWILTLDEDAITPSMLPVVGSFPDSVGNFTSRLKKWFDFESLSPLIRIAFGAILLQQTESKKDGYNRLGQYIPSVTLDPDGSSDFLYQINRPRESKIDLPGLVINRLSKWSVFSAGFVKIGSGIIDPQQSLKLFAARLELDINTSPNINQQLSPEQCKEIFEELVFLGKEIASRGDIP